MNEWMDQRSQDTPQTARLGDIVCMDGSTRCTQGNR